MPAIAFTIRQADRARDRAAVSAIDAEHATRPYADEAALHPSKPRV